MTHDIYFGTITEVLDEEKAEIKFTIPNLVSEAKAKPIFREMKPKEGSEIILLKPPSTFNSLWYYFVTNQDTGLRIKYKDAEVHFTTGSKFEIKNKDTSLKKILTEIIKMYMKTKTIDGKPLDPTSMNMATELIQLINKLF